MSIKHRKEIRSIGYVDGMWQIRTFGPTELEEILDIEEMNQMADVA